MNIKRLGQLILAAALTFVASEAAAGPVHDALTGGLVDPYATNLRIVPPRGGMVMVYQDGKAVAWFMQAGYAQLKPNRIYGVVATKGQSMLFNQRVMLRPGLTQLVWDGSRAPAITYQPAYYTPGYAGSPSGRHHHARPRRTHQPDPYMHPAQTRTRMSAPGNTRLVKKLASLRTDKQRLAVVRTYASKHTFTAAQARAVGRAFDSKNGRASAESALGLKATRKAPSARGRLARI